MALVNAFLSLIIFQINIQLDFSESKATPSQNGARRECAGAGDDVGCIIIGNYEPDNIKVFARASDNVARINCTLNGKSIEFR